MSEIFKIGELPIKTNHPGDFHQYLPIIKHEVKAGVFCGSVEGYWWIIPLEFRDKN